MRVVATVLAALAAVAAATAMEPLARIPPGPAGAMAKRLDDVPFKYCYKTAGGSFRVVSDLPSGVEWLARARYTDDIDKDGWAYMALEGRETDSDSEVALASGYLEGVITWERIEQFAINSYVNRTLGKPLEAWLSKNDDFVDAQVKAHSDADPFWHQVGLLRTQVDGIEAGYNDAAPASARLVHQAFRNMQIGGDLEDLASAVAAQTGTAVEDLVPSGGLREWAGIRGGAATDSTGQHCSALVKLTADDVFISQATWGSLNSMTRTYKRYIFPFRAAAGSEDRVARPSVWMSSYPGTVFSGDDWYVTGADSETDPGMVVLETTIGNSNPDLWKDVVPTSVLEWTRNMVANRLGDTGDSWCAAFERFNSGTYNNEFIVMDNRRIVLEDGKAPRLLDGAITMLDQLPGYVEHHDVTDRLRTDTYIPSYNVPAFPDVFEKSGLVPIERKFGPWFSYNRTARALIFRRNHTDVKDLDGMRALMRYNNFRHDPISRQGQEGLSPPYSAENAIACRDDLNPADGNYTISALGHRNHVETDCKLSSARMLRGEAVATTAADGSAALVGGERFSSLVISGPTHSGEMPPFRFSKSSFDPELPHAGLPDLFAFDWVPVAL